MQVSIKINPTPQAIETDSNLFGRTVNPYNTELSPGGSSGGEAALLALRGSFLGIGTDIGGSVRVPAAWCGIYSLKLSIARTPDSGLQSWFHEGQDSILGIAGPMARNLDDLELYCKVSGLHSTIGRCSDSTNWY